MSNWPSGWNEAVVAEARRQRNASDTPWDEWYGRALSDGVTAPIAELGRQLMERCQRDSWPEELREQAGWLDAGEAMLELARVDPIAAQARWEALLDAASG